MNNEQYTSLLFPLSSNQSRESCWITLYNSRQLVTLNSPRRSSSSFIVSVSFSSSFPHPFHFSTPSIHRRHPSLLLPPCIQLFHFFPRCLSVFSRFASFSLFVGQFERSYKPRGLSVRMYVHVEKTITSTYIHATR